ncbi:MAG: hypothetical protein DRI57_23480 [Deltaproteobacteria bacterium]|nr:MAG: hypothetical protein DRI57_23480 [Deltaproteobacteria bacterium]
MTPLTRTISLIIPTGKAPEPAAGSQIQKGGDKESGLYEMYLQSPGKKAHGKKASCQMVPYVLASNPRTVCNISPRIIFVNRG